MRSCVRFLEAGPFRRPRSFTADFRSACSASPTRANGNGVLSGSNPGRQFAVPNRVNRVGVPLYRKTPYPGVTVNGTRQWLNPDAFVSVVDPTTGACHTGISACRTIAR